MATLYFGPPIGGPFCAYLMVVPRKDLRDNHLCGTARYGITSNQGSVDCPVLRTCAQIDERKMDSLR